MHYQYARERPDYSDLASGRVFYSLSGRPAFPIRLASEILQRCLAIRAANGSTTPCVLYDPCCGGAYHLSVLAYLHWHSIREVIGSDVDAQAVALAQQNLELLGRGLDTRINEISAMLEQYGKESHRAALSSAYTMQERITALQSEHPLPTRAFQASAVDGQALHDHLQGTSVDIILADVPYGWQSQWRDLSPPQRPDLESHTPLWAMLEALSGILMPTSLVAIVSDKQQKASHASYQRVEQFQVGKRRVVILRLCT